MSLQGSLETFALPDVLVLLSSTKKDGELRVVGGRVDGKVWLEKGQIVHTMVGGKEVEPVDAVFELLRLDNGTFNFDADAEAPRRSEPIMIDLVLADAQVRLGEWQEIAKVVPHLDAVVDMAAEAPGDEVIVSRDHWHLLRKVAGGRSIHELMAAIGYSEYETCKTVKELLDAQLVSIDVSPPKSSPAAKAEPDVAPAPARAEAEPEPERARKPAPAPEEASTDSPPAGPTKLDPADRAAASLRATEKPTEDAGPAATTARDELDELAELASRPRKVRATTSSEGSPSEPTSRPAATKTQTNGQPVEEAKALVAQLAALSGDDEEAVAAKVTEHLASGGELPEVPDGDEPINRGLLLKFLSSVRN